MNRRGVFGAIAVVIASACGGGATVQSAPTSTSSSTTSIAPVATTGNPTTTRQRVPTTTTPTLARHLEIAESVRQFAIDATAQNFATIPFDDGPVLLALGPYILSTRTPNELADPAQWTMGTNSTLGGDYAEYEFAPLRALAAASGVSVTTGGHTRCANPPTTLPPGTEQLTQIAIQPIAVPSCLSWFAVDLFLRDGRIVAVRYDLWGP